MILFDNSTILNYNLRFRFLRFIFIINKVYVAFPRFPFTMLADPFLQIFYQVSNTQLFYLNKENFNIEYIDIEAKILTLRKNSFDPLKLWSLSQSRSNIPLVTN